MKKLLLITVLLVVTTTEIIAQNNKAIEINQFQNFHPNKENNQFKIKSNEEVNVYLKFNLKKEDNFDVLILDRHEKIVFSRKYNKVGENKICFNMEEDQQYTVKFRSTEPLNLVVTSLDKK